MERRAKPKLGKTRHLVVKLLAAEPRVGHVLVHVVVVLVVLVVTLGPRPEGYQQGSVAKMAAHAVDPRVVAESGVAAVMSFR